MRVTRREFIGLLAEGAFTITVMRTMALIPSPPQDQPVRPPGAVKEEYFNQLCVRCGVCTEVCPTKTIDSAGFLEGITVYNTPKINPLKGPCEFYRGRCDEVTECGSHCPTGALQQVDREEAKIGTVELIPDKCLAYLEKECVVCYEMCPVVDAITLTGDLKPVFHEELCVGCGTCIYFCPADPKALKLSSKGARWPDWPV